MRNKPRRTMTHRWRRAQAYQELKAYGDDMVASYIVFPPADGVSLRTYWTRKQACSQGFKRCTWRLVKARRRQMRFLGTLAWHQLSSFVSESPVALIGRSWAEAPAVVDKSLPQPDWPATTAYVNTYSRAGREVIARSFYTGPNLTGPDQDLTP